ncbi:molybdopterin-dependent oxidoreductase, partial [Escherichia coli]|nr:molybdopterin-dependent oxidoreductase [Escherichia coli]
KYLAELKEKVAKGEINVLSVDPVKNKTQRYLENDHLYINPMTDVAFMLAVAHVLYNENLYDKKFIDTYCLGFEEFIQYVQGKTKDKV